jgi:phosphate uptake regulator
MRDTEVDRLDWLVARQYNLSVSDILLADKLGTTREHAVNFMLISRVLERMGDHSVRMALQVEDLASFKAKKTHLKRILRTADTILPVLDDVISALFQRDSKLAHNAMEQANRVLVDIHGFKEDIADSPGGAGLPMGMVVDSLDRTVHYIKDIGELVINYAIDKA